LSSLASQSVHPDEVIIVLKPSGDNSEQVIGKFKEKLPIRMLIQEKGFVVDAVEEGIKNATGDIILFLDDDAIAEKEWIKKYLNLFGKIGDAGGIAGLILKASLKDTKIDLENVLSDKYPPTTPHKVSKFIKVYGKPLNIYKGYSNYISKSGFLINKQMNTRKQNIPILDVLLSGANMGFLKHAIKDCPVGRFFKGSKKGYSYESFLAYWARRKGFNTYAIRSPENAPTVWHIVHKSRLTFLNNFYDRFWFSYDALMNYFRYRLAGADTSLLSYIVASAAFIRKDPCSRLPALFYILSTMPVYLKEIRSYQTYK
jgi:glycosyltransferase involved in cell wall biosynthesis